MKKSLVLAMAMAMGVTASAYAANPFSDVPAGHWAYDAVAQLADAGVVEGYGASFGGDKLMTRYEMAQLVAKAMAKGGNCDKLAAEFADELDALGVKVAALEKKVDNVKITGNIRYSYRDNTDNSIAKLSGRGSGAKGYNRFRTRLTVNGQINKNWKYTGLLENDNYLDKNATTGTVNLKRAWLDGRVGGVKLSAGRIYPVQGDMIDAEVDGIKVTYKFDKVNLTGLAAKNVSGGNRYKTNLDEDRLYMAKADTKFGKLGAFVQYWKYDAAPADEIFELGLDYPVAKGLKMNAQYYNGDALANQDDNGFEVGLTYLGAKAAKPGSWGAWVTYSDRPAATYIKPTAFNTYAFQDTKEGGFVDCDGYKGFEIGANYAFAKNIVGTVRYYDLKGREGAKNESDTLWADVTFTF